MADQLKIGFKSDFSDLLHVMNGISRGAKELFLRELVLNASRALLHLRVATALDENYVIGPRGPSIDIIPDKSNGTLSIIDYCIGMKESDLKILLSVQEPALGNYKKAARKLLENEVEVGWFYTPDCDLSLGFPAVFMVADIVEVTTKHCDPGSKPLKLFSSASDNYFFIEDAISSTPRGTKVTLHLKKDHFEYLDEVRLKKLIDKYPFELCRYPVSICSPAGNIIEQRLADVEVKKKDINVLKDEFAGLQQLFKEVLVGKRPYLRDVVVSDQYSDIPTVLSLDRKTLYISPRCSLIEKLRHDAELNCNDPEVLGLINFQHLSGLGRIALHDSRYQTNHSASRWDLL